MTRKTRQIRGLGRNLVNLIGVGLFGIGSSIPFQNTKADDFELLNYGGNGVVGSVMNIGHYSGAMEGLDAYDSKWSDAPGNPNPKWLKICTEPTGEELQGDYRDLPSKTTFQCKMKGVSSAGNIACTNYVLFNFLDEDTNRVYRYSLNMPTNYSANGQAFTASGIMTNGLRINTPGITNLSNNATAWIMDIISEETAPKPPKGTMFTWR